MFDALTTTELLIPEMTSLRTAPFDRNLETRQSGPLQLSVWHLTNQRWVVFPPALVEELKSFVALCRNLYDQKTDAVFTTEGGEKLTPRQVYTIFKDIARKAGIRGIPLFLRQYKGNALG